MPRILVDCKNLALYAGGIAAFFRPLLAHWIASRPNYHFVLLAPAFDTGFLPATHNWQWVPVPWPQSLPRKLRHPVYDNVLFPWAASRQHYDLVFSPYHDVRLPSGKPAVMMIHDTCIQDLPGIYPAAIRFYYQTMLRQNLKVATNVLTVSQASRTSVAARYGLNPDQLGVIYNTLDTAFFTADTESEALALRQSFTARTLMFYPGGSDHRKNVARLVTAIQGMDDTHLVVTGPSGPQWDALGDRVTPVGRLDTHQLMTYYRAADVVAYPTLCEGFGRLCLEAMAVGTPLACSDLPVLREVSGDYAEYFDPLDEQDMVNAIHRALARGRQTPQVDARFAPQAVADAFLSTMDAIIAKAGL